MTAHLTELDDLSLLEAHARRLAQGQAPDMTELVLLLGRLEIHGRWPRYLQRILCESLPKLRESGDARRQFFHAARALVSLRRYGTPRAA